MEWMPKWWIEALFAAILSLMGLGFRWVIGTIKAQKKGVQALLRDRIIQAYNHYMEKGECPIYALENVLALFKEYKALGGNGAVERLINEIKGLPTDKSHREV